MPDRAACGSRARLGGGPAHFGQHTGGMWREEAPSWRSLCKHEPPALPRQASPASPPPLARILTSSLRLSLILAPTLNLSLFPALPLTRRAYPYP